MEIPNKLKFCRFNRVGKRDKRAFEKGWQNKPYDYYQINEFFPEENYGVMCGEELRVLDDDTPDKRLIKLFIDKFGETFRVRDHLYFSFENGHAKKIVLFDGNQHLGEIQGEGSYVVGPGSIHPSGEVYETKNDSPVRIVFYEEFMETFGKYIKSSNTVKHNEVELSEEDNKIITQVVAKWKEGDRQNLALALSGYLRKERRLGFDRVKGIVQDICEKTGDMDVAERFKAVQETFMKDENMIKGITGLFERDIVEDYTQLKKDVFLALAVKDRDKASELIVGQIKKENNIYTTRDDVKSEMWIYKEGIYVPQGKSFVREFCRDILGQAYTTQFSNLVVAKIETDTFIEHDEFFNTNYIWEIPLMNGILNIQTRELKPHSPEKIFFNKVPIVYDSEAECPAILQHLNSVLKSKEDVQVMLEIFGFLLLKEYRIEKAFMFVGAGRNGKSKTIELMKRFVGAENCASLALKSLKEDSFSLSELFGKMANLAADLSKTDLKETGIVKSLIGRDTIQAHRKYLRDLLFVNYAKLCFAANELPKIYDTTDGFWTKWVLLEFPYKFVTQKHYDEAKEEDRKKMKIKDDNIVEKITHPSELSGLLNLALDGLDRLLEQKDFSYSKSTSEVKDIWVRKSDSFTAFCYDHLVEDPESKISKKLMRKLYHGYTKKYKTPGCSDKAIKVTLESIFGVSETKGADWERYWEGVNFKDLEGLKS